MSELKPCPFCGESKLLYSGGCGFRYDDDDNQIRLFRVHCRTCKGRTGLFESLDEAVEAWNRRTNSTTIQPSALGTNLAEVGTDIPDINVGEFISRQAAINAIDECYCGGEDSCGEPWIYKENAVEAINMIEPISSAEPKRGKWIYCEDSTADCVDGYRCDQCGFFVPWDYKHKGIDFIQDYNFCPNCGANMREVTE